MNMTWSGNGSENESISTIQHFKDTYPVASWEKLGLFDEAFIKSINVHWLQFLPPHNISQYVLAVLYVLIMITGWCGNAFVVFMYFRCPALQTPANILVVNLAISDFLMMSKMPVFIFNSIFLGPALGSIGCSIYGFLGGLTGTVSICTLAAISLDRYYVIKYPLHMEFTSLRVKIGLGVVWCYGIVFAGMPLLKLKIGTYVPEGYLTSCSFDYLSPETEVKVFILLFFMAAWLVPFLLILFCYVNIFLTVLKTQNKTKKGSESSRHMKIEEKRRQEVKLAMTVLVIIFLWFAAWTPYAVVALLGISNRSDLITPLSSMIPALFCKSASCVDPFVYALTNPKFKAEVRKTFSRGVSAQGTASRVWSTAATQDTSTATTQSVKQKIYRMHSCRESEEVEEEIVPVGNKAEDAVVKNKKLEPSTSIQEDIVTIQQDTEMASVKPPPFWYKPSFSNRSSSTKNIARRLSTRRIEKSSSCEYCEKPDGDDGVTS